MLPNTVLLTTDNATWHALAARGMPVLLDRVFPERAEYGATTDGSGAGSINRVFDVAKHYWGATIISHGYRALYLDADVATLENPLPYFDQGWDVQVKQGGDGADGLGGEWQLGSGGEGF